MPKLKSFLARRPHRAGGPVVGGQPPSHVTRRELLKLSPLVLLGGFAVPAWRDRLLETGVRWSDAASGLLFRHDHLVESYPDRDVVPFEKFPYNFYDVLEPDIDFAHWTLSVGGAVARPGKYTLDQIRALPKVDPQHAPRLRRGLGRGRALRRRAHGRFPDDGRRRSTRAVRDGHLR